MYNCTHTRLVFTQCTFVFCKTLPISQSLGSDSAVVFRQFWHWGNIYQCVFVCHCNIYQCVCVIAWQRLLVRAYLRPITASKKLARHWKKPPNVTATIRIIIICGNEFSSNAQISAFPLKALFSGVPFVIRSCRTRFASNSKLLKLGCGNNAMLSLVYTTFHPLSVSQLSVWNLCSLCTAE